MPRLPLPERFLRDVEVDDLLRYSQDTDPGLAIVLARIDGYLRAARTQQRRIGHLDTRIRKRSKDDAPGVSRSMAGDIAAMAVEIHYYLICWNAVSQQLRLLQGDTGSRGISEVLRINRVTLEDYTRMRDNLEHFDERLMFRGRKGPRGSATRPMRNPWDFGNFSRNAFSFGGDRVDISAKSLQRLREIVGACTTKLKSEVWESIASGQPAIAERLLRSYARNLRLRGILRNQHRAENSAEH